MSQYPSASYPSSGGPVPPPPVPSAPHPGGYGPMPRRRSAWPAVGIGCLVVVLLVIAAVIVFPLLALVGVSGGAGLERGNVAVIDVSGEIHSGGGGLLAEAGADQPIMEMLRKAGDDDSIKAVVLNINSPGGGPAASQAIAEEVRRLDARKPVFAAMGDEAASGAYYIASSCRKIVANPATLTGSIGVVMETMTFQKLLQKYGIDAGAITTGKYKDMGSPFREMRPDERALIEAMLQDTYGQFVSDVAKGRKMDPAKVRALADGRVWTGAQAKEIGLVDELGNLYDAIKLAGKEAGIKGKASPRFLGEPRTLADLLRSSSRMRVPVDAPAPLPAASAHPLWLYEGPGAPPVAGSPGP